MDYKNRQSPAIRIASGDQGDRQYRERSMHVKAVSFRRSWYPTHPLPAFFPAVNARRQDNASGMPMLPPLLTRRPTILFIGYQKRIRVSRKRQTYENECKEVFARDIHMRKVCKITGAAFLTRSGSQFLNYSLISMHLSISGHMSRNYPALPLR